MQLQAKVKYSVEYLNYLVLLDGFEFKLNTLKPYPSRQPWGWFVVFNVLRIIQRQGTHFCSQNKQKLFSCLFLCVCVCCLFTLLRHNLNLKCPQGNRKWKSCLFYHFKCFFKRIFWGLCPSSSPTCLSLSVTLICLIDPLQGSFSFQLLPYTFWCAWAVDSARPSRGTDTH